MVTQVSEPPEFVEEVDVNDEGLSKNVQENAAEAMGNERAGDGASAKGGVEADESKKTATPFRLCPLCAQTVLPFSFAKPKRQTPKSLRKNFCHKCTSAFVSPLTDVLLSCSATQLQSTHALTIPPECLYQHFTQMENYSTPVP